MDARQQQAAQQLAEDVLEWERQYGPTDPKEVPWCELDPDDWARMVRLARKVKGHA